MSEIDTEIAKPVGKIVRPIPDLDQEWIPPEPAKESQDLCKLLNDIVEALRSYIVFPSDSSYVAVALWTTATHVSHTMTVAPYLMVTSPRPSCGKSRLLEVLEFLARDAQRSGNMSLAVLFRSIEERDPTLLIDEFDNLDLSTRSEMIGLLNMGHRRGEKVMRAEASGRAFILNEYKVFGLKAIASIAKNYPPALESRCIDITMDRKLSHEVIRKFRIKTAQKELKPIYARLLRWASDNASELFHGYLAIERGDMPEELSDRECDLWEGLYAIAEMAGSNWLDLARVASLELKHQAINDEDDSGLQLLGDLRDIFAKYGEQLWSKDIEKHLNENEARTWSGWNRGNGIKPPNIGKLLRPFKIKSKQIKIAGINRMGYRLKDCNGAFTRYLSSVGPTSPTSISFDDRDKDIPF